MRRPIMNDNSQPWKGEIILYTTLDWAARKQ